MKKLTPVVSLRAVLGLGFIVALFVFGNIPAVKAQDASSLEGEWIVQSSWDSKEIGSRTTIVRKGDEYKVTSNAPIAQGHNISPFYGTPTQIMATHTPSYDDLVYMFSPKSDLQRSALEQAADKVTKRLRITLSSDGRPRNTMKMGYTFPMILRSTILTTTYYHLSSRQLWCVLLQSLFP
jgi:hypothetical protein